MTNPVSSFGEVESCSALNTDASSTDCVLGLVACLFFYVLLHSSNISLSNWKVILMEDKMLTLPYVPAWMQWKGGSIKKESIKGK